MKENIFVFRKYMPKYLGVKNHRVSKLTLKSLKEWHI